MDFGKIKEEQIRLARKVILKDKAKEKAKEKEIELIGAADQAFFSNKVVSVVIVCDTNFNTVDEASAVLDVKMPYIPGFLFYREGIAVIEAFHKLGKKPDVLMIDANGILHPLRFGMASQIGVLLDTPTIGIAKNKMLGKAEDGKIIVNNEIRGAEVRTKEFAKPLYVSPGHKISLERSIELVRQCVKLPHKLPEPLHLAHRAANKLRDKLAEEKAKEEKK